MAKISITWIVKNNTGQIKGPYTTVEVLKYISDGFFTGEEQIAKYPGGQWTSITKQPEFYERILETLEEQINPNAIKEKKAEPIQEKKQNSETKSKPNKNSFEETVIIPYGGEKVPTKKTLTVPDDMSSTTRPDIKKQLSTTEIRQIQRENTNDVIELNNITEESTKDKKDILRWPLFLGILLIASLVLYFGFFGGDGPVAGERVRLIAPQKSKEGYTEDQVNQKVIQAMLYLASDNVENYLEAQTLLVNIIENSIKNLKARMVLCEVYKELWPFSHQDNQDQKVISYVAKTTRSMNKIDSSGYFCEAVKLYTEGRYSEAMGTVDAIIEKDYANFLLYQIKGEILEIENELLIAESFFQKARELSGKWVKPLFSQAMVNLRNKEINKASSLFQQALRENKKHKASYFGLGILEFSRNQYDTALNLLNSGMNIESMIDKNLEAQGIETLSEIYLMRGDKSKALSLANLSLSKNPSRKTAQELCNRLGGCDRDHKNAEKPDEELLFNCQMFLRQKEYVHAQAECKAAFELNPKNSTAALKAGEALWSLGQGLEAIDWINRAIKTDPTSVRAYIKKAEFLAQRFDFSEAEKTLMQADYLSKGNFEIQRGFANLAFKKKDYNGAIKLAEKALKLYDADIESIILYSSSAREIAAVTKVTNQKEQEIRQKMAQDAYGFALKAIELDSTNVEAQINYAKVIATRQGVDEGGDYLNELIKKYPKIHEYRIALAEVYIEEERYKQASELLGKVLAMNENNKKARMLIAKCLNQLGFSEKAMGEYLKASYIDPSDAEPIFEVAKIYLETSRLNEAKNQFERVIKLNSRFPRAHLFLGRTYLLNGNFIEAEKNAEAEKKLYPNLIDSYLLVGEIKFASKSYSECAAEYAKATNAGSQPVYIYVRAARCYRLSGQIDMAQGFLDIAAERESGYEEIYKEQGALFEARGDRPAAIRSYCKYLELSPNSKDKQEFVRQVQTLGGDCGD